MRWSLDIVIVYQGSGEFIPFLSQKYPTLPIIFSTWEWREIQSADISPAHWIVRSKPPLWRGPSNLNLQKTSTLAGLRHAKYLGFQYALKIRDDMDIEPLGAVLELLSLKSQEKPMTRLWFLDWVLHLSGYPMDFLQFGETGDLIALWERVSLGVPNAGLAGFLPEASCPEVRLKRAFCHEFAPNPFKKIGFLASDFMTNPNIDIHWMKRKLTMRRHWAGNPQFVQLSAFHDS